MVLRTSNLAWRGPMCFALKPTLTGHKMMLRTSNLAWRGPMVLRTQWCFVPKRLPNFLEKGTFFQLLRPVGTQYGGRGDGRAGR